MQKIIFNGTNKYAYYEKLDSGLDVYMYNDKSCSNYYMSLNVRFGSLDTEYKIKNKTYKTPNGTAHYLEHKCFDEKKGTAYDYFDKTGTYANAFTTYDYTSFNVEGSAAFAKDLNTLVSFVLNKAFTEEKINKERNIIKEEIRMYEEEPNSKLNYNLEYNLNKYDKHKYMVCGTEDDIKKINYDILSRTYDHFYNPSNMFLVITGNFKPLEALGILKEFFKDKKYPNIEYTILNKKEPLEVVKKCDVLNMNVKLSKVMMGIKLSKRLFSKYDFNMLPIYLDTIMNIKFGPTSDTLEYLKENNICKNIAYNTEVRTDYILISLTFDTDYEREALELLERELNDIVISDESLRRAIRVSVASFVRTLSNMKDMAEYMEGDILGNNGITDNILELYRSMNIDDINDIASKINTNNMSISAIRP